MERAGWSRWELIWPGAALVCMGLTWWACAALERGSVGQRLWVAAALTLCALLGLVLLYREGWRGKWLLRLALPLALAMGVRALCLDYASGDYNSFLAHWYNFFRENGGVAALSQPVGNYNVPYLYMIAAISYLDIPDLYLYKLFSIVFDVILAWGGLRLVKTLRGEREGDWWPLVAFGILLFLPTVVLNGAYWGQCDGVYGAFALHAVAQLLRGRNKSSLILLALAFSFKLQTVFLLPLWGVYWLAGKVKFSQLWIFPLVFGATMVPALALGKPLMDILGVYVGQTGEYADLTLNAPSIYQFLPYYGDYPEALLARLGIGAAFLLALAMLAVGWRRGKGLTLEQGMGIALVLAVGIPFFLPHMHERYFFLADVLGVCWAFTRPRRVVGAVLICASSLGSYLVYLTLRYYWVIPVGEDCLVMFWQALAMALALVFCVGDLVYTLAVGRGRRERI